MEAALDMSEILSRAETRKLTDQLLATAEREMTEWDAADGHILLPKHMQVSVEIDNDKVAPLVATIEALAAALVVSDGESRVYPAAQEVQMVRDKGWLK